MEQHIIYMGPHKFFGGHCVVYKFPNLWGASVVRHHASKGGREGFWEVALISFPDSTKDEYIIRLDTPIMLGETPGYLFIDEVFDILEKIKGLTTSSELAE